MLLRNTRPEPTNAEDGYLLLTVLVMIFLMLLALSVAAPRVAKQIQRDKEQEAVHRGLQYKRAIQLYYKKFGAYPTDIKQLENTNQIRFLRKRYKDPITGKDDWRLIHMGEAKVPPMGFFGQPLQAGMSSASTGPGLGTGSGGTPGLYANSDTSGTNGSATGTQGTSGTTANGGSSSSFGFSNNNSSNTNSPGGTGSTGFGFNNSTTPSTGGIGTTPTGTNGPGASNTSGGSTFGSGGPIVGIGIPVKKDSVIEYHKQKKYSDWEFVYDPQEELLMNSGGIANGGNVNGAGANSNGAGIGTNGTNGSSGSSSFGFSNSGSSGSSGSGFGSSGSSGSSGSGFGNFGSSPSSGPGGSSPPSTPNSPQQ